MRAGMALEPESLSLPPQSAPQAFPGIGRDEVGPEPAGPPAGGMPPETAEEPEVDLAVDLDEAELHLRMVEVDALRKRGRFEEALGLLQGAPLVADDPRRVERLAGIGAELGRAAVERGLAEEGGTKGLPGELKRLMRLDRSRAYRDALAEELAPLAADEDSRRVRELLAEGHLHAALLVVEKVRSLGPRIPEFRMLVRETVHAVVSEAKRLQVAGDEAFRKGDRAAAEAAWTEALGLLENDRMLVARMARLGADSASR
jgi:tetratricopeptide (TPR) repeat protein